MKMMIQPRPLPREEVRERMQQYQAQIAPIVRHMAMLESLRRPHIVLGDDGHIELDKHEPLPPELQATWDQCQAMIDEIRKQLFPGPDEVMA